MTPPAAAGRTPPSRGDPTAAGVPDGKIIRRVIHRLRGRYPSEHFTDTHGRDPFRLLIGCLLSLRTRDEDSFPATQRLFRRARTPRGMLRVDADEISRIIFPVGFYRRKAAQIHAICRELLERHDGRVPSSIDELVGLTGVGRKTANLVVTLGFGLPGICVDTHVHRISHRLGWVRTRGPDQTEESLRRFLPAQYWIEINGLLVRHGQETCRPISPLCSRCVVAGDCPRAGVGGSR